MSHDDPKGPSEEFEEDPAVQGDASDRVKGHINRELERLGQRTSATDQLGDAVFDDPNVKQSISDEEHAAADSEEGA